MMKRKFFDGRAIFGASMSFGIFFNTNKQGAAYDVAIRHFGDAGSGSAQVFKGIFSNNSGGGRDGSRAPLKPVHVNSPIVREQAQDEDNVGTIRLLASFSPIRTMLSQ
jgi:hypothetical protein